MQAQLTVTLPIAELHSIAKVTMAAERGRRGELFGEDAPVGENDALRRQVVGTRRNLDIAKPLGSRMLEQRAERLRGVAATPFRGHDRVANVAETVRRKRLRAGLPAEAGTPAELAIPHPDPVSRQAPHGAPVR